MARLFKSKSRTVPLKLIYAMQYGGSTMSFERHKAKLVADIASRRKRDQEQQQDQVCSE